MKLKLTIIVILISCCFVAAFQLVNKTKSKHDQYQPILSDTNTRTQDHTVNDNGASALRRRHERQIAIRLREEILWDGTIPNFHVPEGGLAEVAFYQKGQQIWYCSRDLGICESYKLDGRDIDWSSGRVKYNTAEPDIDSAVRVFAGELPIKKPDKSSPQIFSGVAQGQGVIGLSWTAKLKLGTQQEIINQHKQMRPAELIGLREHLREDLKDAGYRSITIACFDPFEGSVQIYGDGSPPRSGQVVFSERWDDEREQWIFVSMLVESQDPESFAKQKAKILAIACDTIKFK